MELLEREGFLTELEVALAEASSGAGRIALVSGEAGIGKTSLVAAFINRRPNSARVLWGVCDALFTPRPLGPLYDMAVQIQGDLLALLSSDASRALIFSTVLIELQQRATIIVFEDVHWADEATLDLLHYIGRRITQTSALLVMTYRDDELGPHHVLRWVLGDLVSSITTRRILLPPLTEKAVRTMIGDRGIDASALYHQTGGNPFFITEVLASQSSGIPPTIRDAVLARAARLSPSGRAVLEAAAVIGSRIENWLLAEVTGSEAQAAEESLRLGMLLAQGGALAFRHELARQTILETISPLRKQVLHKFVLDAMKASPEKCNDFARLAHHAEGAGDREAVLAYAPAAAKQAAIAKAHREAVRHYEQALRYADSLPVVEYASLLEAYARECNYIGQQKEGILARRKALELWRTLGNALKEGENLAYLMDLLVRTGQNAEAQRVSRASIEILEALPPGRELAMAYRVWAAACLVNRDCEEALVWAEKALELAERFQDAEVLAAVHLTIGTAWLFLDYEQGRQYLESKIMVLHDAGMEARLVHMYSNLGSGSGELHQFHYAERYLTTGITYAIDRDLDSHLLYMQAWLALTHLYRGRWQDADQIARQVIKNPYGTVISRITALVALGRLKARLGDPGLQVELDKALTLATQAGNLQRLGPVRSARAEAAWLAGDHEQALVEAHSVYELAVSKRHPWFTGELAFWRWRAGEKVEIPAWTARPFALHISGDWQAAATEWGRLGCPYEQARALADGDVSANVQALEIFEKLTAQPVADALRQKLRAAGIANIPPKPRSSTRNNPFGLTDRQVEILSLLSVGLSNANIAAQLHISPKTVDHHVSAVLARLDVHSRDAAAALARQHPHFK